MQWTGKAVVFKDFPKYVLTSCLDTMFFVAQDEALLADGGIKHLKYVLKLSNIVWRCHFKTVTSCVASAFPHPQVGCVATNVSKAFRHSDSTWRETGVSWA